MESSAKEFFTRLLETPGPSGYEQPVQRLVREYAQAFADDVTTDVHGNVICSVNPHHSKRLMFAGHCDQIGMLVSHIDDEGFVYAQTIGGWDPQQLVGQRMVIWTESGPVAAVVSRKPIHLLNDQERKQVVKLTEMWLDVGADSKEDAQAVVEIGDPVTLKLGLQEMRNSLFNAPAMDNRTGVWVVIEALRRAKLMNPVCALFAVSTVQEEIGLRGAQTSAFGIDPHAAIAVDVTHATDCPSIDKKQLGDICLGKGPVVFRGPNMNPQVVQRICELSASHQIPMQLAAIGRGASNDANALQLNRAGVATGLVSIPNRYMHSAVETISLEDLDSAAELLAQFAVAYTEQDDFTPV